MKACPPRSRVPLPWEWAAGLAALLHRRGRTASAVALLVCFDTYVRPGALLQVRVEDVLTPLQARGLDRWGLQLFPQERGVLSKTGTQHDTVIFGNFDVDLLPLLGTLLRGKAGQEFLFGVTMAEYKTHFDQAAADLMLSSHNLVTYQARHGGTTRDFC